MSPVAIGNNRRPKIAAAPGAGKVSSEMSAFGTKRTWRQAQPMSAFEGKADIVSGVQTALLNRIHLCGLSGIAGDLSAITKTNEAGSVHNQTMNMLPNEPTQERIDHIGGVIGKVIVIALAAFFLWGYSTTFLAQVGLFF